MEDTSLFVWGALFGIIGIGFFTYGKKQHATVPLIVGIALFVIPYLISNLYLLVITGVVLVVIPYFLRI